MQTVIVEHRLGLISAPVRIQVYALFGSYLVLASLSSAATAAAIKVGISALFTVSVNSSLAPSGPRFLRLVNSSLAPWGPRIVCLGN